jgi:hypothetical protein
MGNGFTKLHSGILTSTIWREDPATKVVWVTLLAMADQDGTVEASVPGLAALANVSIEQTEVAVQKFTSPDKYSRTPDREGRRIEPMDGGWRLLNYEKYREKLSQEDLKRKACIRQQRCRAKIAQREKRDTSVTGCDSHEESRMSRQAEADREAEADELKSKPFAHSSNEPEEASPAQVVRGPKLKKAKLAALAAELFSNYPRKVAKKDAVKAIERAIATVATRGATDTHQDFEGHEETAKRWLETRVVAYASSPQGRREDRSLIPHPATWFNGARYDDDEAEWNHVGNVNGTAGHRMAPGAGARVRTAIDRHREYLAQEEA